MTSDRDSNADETEAQRLNSGVYRWTIRALFIAFLMGTLILAFMNISLVAVAVVGAAGVIALLLSCIVALSYSFRKTLLLRRIGREAYIQQEAINMSRRQPVGRRARILYISVFGVILLLEVVVQVVRLAALRH